MKNNALIIIDFINDLTHPHGKVAKGHELLQKNHVIERVNQSIDHARKNDWLLVFVRVGFSDHYPECLQNSPIFAQLPQKEALKLGTWGTNFLDSLHLKQDDLIITKHRISPFYGTELDLILRTHPIKNVFVSGFSTDMAVQSMVREGHDRGYNMIVIIDACSAHTEENHHASLLSLSRLAQLMHANDLQML
ncbi:cysteine hydrolase family protein [Legionella oakridgensis]|uniref:Amidases related to nicotinamidase n=2 Tax=Legionella oakridgensis TaxID=29423 RepID=W0BID1_9GAMM|nr:cysteine hydrolase [Legionella oakridgensis]AHE68184.1 amidases related to nicotinamidase [Legionella oakridgensis ATCC 33761 = DSM 21215]ETO92271.1 amidase [Legionella oakridgensis RV-2-2007]KTD39617.1 isochorismatase [Legionella oakridgensis]STY21147.1 isochorismatase [Legionella longbeachae]